MSRQKTDAEYLKSDELGLVIAKGMAVMYKENPKNPVDFLAKWLLNYSQVERAAEQKQDAMRIVDDHISAYREKQKVLELEKEEEKKDADAAEAKKQDFQMRIAASMDLNDELQSLVDHLQENTGATAVYIGKLVSPKKQISDDDNDEAHIDAAAEKLVHFSHCSKGYDFLVDQTLEKNMGLTFDVFKDQVDDEGKTVESTEPVHVLIPEVVREPKIHFFKVPRLGSYLAVRLEYDSCLFIDAYNDGVKDYLNMKQKIAEQEELKREHEEKERERKDECEANETEYVYDAGKWDEITPKPFKTQKISFVVCLNTLGQDRCFSKEQVDFTLDIVKKYTKEWQRIEHDNLKSDIERKLNDMEMERVYKESNEALDLAELERRAEEATVPEEGKEPLTDDERTQIMQKTKFELLTKQFKDPEGLSMHMKMIERERARNNASQDRERTGTPNTSAMGDPAAGSADEKFYPLAPEHWKQPAIDLKEVHIMKMPRVLQTLFYLLKYAREEICERDTNKLDFKKVKPLIGDDLFDRMVNYQPFGPNEGEFETYQKLAFLTKNLDGINEETVDEFSLVLGKLLRWVKMAIEIRSDDVRKRKNIVYILKHEREMALKADQDRNAKRDDELAQEKAVSKLSSAV